jgi:hypothetical protein
VLYALYFATFVPATLLVLMELKNWVPPRLSCDCTMFRIRPHWCNAGQFAMFLCCLTCAVLLWVEILFFEFHAITFVGSLVWALCAWKTFWQWYKHWKNRKKKFKGRMLGVVRVLQGRLKVVAVPVATFALLGALSGCGEASAPEPTYPSGDNGINYTVVQVERDVTYPDGQKKQVVCLLYDGYKAGGLSCDWAQAGGSR